MKGFELIHLYLTLNNVETRPSCLLEIQGRQMQDFSRATGYSNFLMMAIIEALLVINLLVGPLGLITEGPQVCNAYGQESFYNSYGQVFILLMVASGLDTIQDYTKYFIILFFCVLMRAIKLACPALIQKSYGIQSHYEI